VSVDEKYCRENLEQFFRWRATESIEDFPDEIDCEAKAAKIAAYKFRAVGYVTFKSNYRGKRFFWIERGIAEEIDGMDCFLKVRELKRERSKSLIYQKIFNNRTLGEIERCEPKKPNAVAER
jgi:hypothetical protein